MTDRPSLDNEVTYRRFLYYGPPGKGKTTAIADCANAAYEEGGKVIFVDADNGLKAQALQVRGINTSVIEPYRDVSYEGLEKLHDEVHGRIADGEFIYAVCWDTTTKTASVQLETIQEEAYRANMRKPESQRKPRGPHDVWQDDYGILAQQMRKLLRRFHSLPCHLLVGAHERKDKDEDTGRIVVQPAMSPAVITDFNGYMDVIIHCRTEDFPQDQSLADQDFIEFTGLTRPRGKFTAKDRFGLTPAVMVNPTFRRVAAYLDGEITKDKDPLQKAAIARRTVKQEEEAKAAEAKASEEVNDGEGTDAESAA